MPQTVIGSGANQDYGGSPAATIYSASFTLGGGEFVSIGMRYLANGGGSSLTPSLIQDDNGNIYAVDVQEYVSGGEDVILASCPNAIGGAGNVVQIDFAGGSVQYWGVGYILVSDTALTSPLVASAVGNSLSSPVTTGAFSTTDADTIGIAVASNAAGGTSWTPAGGYVQELTDSIGALMMMYQVYASPQTGVTVSTANSGPVRLEMAFGAYKAAGGGGGAIWSDGQPQFPEQLTHPRPTHSGMIPPCYKAPDTVAQAYLRAQRDRWKGRAA